MRTPDVLWSVGVGCLQYKVSKALNTVDGNKLQPNLVVNSVSVVPKRAPCCFYLEQPPVFSMVIF